MAVEATTHSPEVQDCREDVVYILAIVFGISLLACLLLALWVVRLKRRQNGYAVIGGNTEELRKYKEMYEEEKEEKEQALERLSKLMSDRLTDSNPNIANLSDVKRPTKLADEFSELYDNAWTDAYDCIEDKDDDEDKGKIEFLLQILQISFGYCKLQTSDQLAQLNWLLSCPGKKYDKTKSKPENVNKDFIKGFKDERKRLAAKTWSNLSEDVFVAVKAKFKGSPWEKEVLKEPVETFCRQCVELSWFLSVQDPSMDLQFTCEKPENFKAYTKTGQNLDFIVWPPLYLYSGGNLMAKGIAQFR